MRHRLQDDALSGVGIDALCTLVNNPHFGKQVDASFGVVDDLGEQVDASIGVVFDAVGVGAGDLAFPVQIGVEVDAFRACGAVVDPQCAGPAASADSVVVHVDGSDGLPVHYYEEEEAPDNRETANVDNKILSYVELHDCARSAFLTAIHKNCVRFLLL